MLAVRPGEKKKNKKKKMRKTKKKRMKREFNTKLVFLQSTYTSVLGLGQGLVGELHLALRLFLHEHTKKEKQNKIS